LKLKHPLIAATLAVILAAPAFAQQQAPDKPSMNAQQTSPAAKPADQAAAGGEKAGFVQSQNASEWRGSKLIGATVYGNENESIGEINDVLIGDSGNIKAAIVGVGGFIGIGEKNVAIPFAELNIKRKPDSSAIDKITVSYTKDQLKNAPKFAFYEAPGSQTTGAGGTTQPAGSAPMNSPQK
jgi:hypothetical protein